jgi:hypothetical protein
MRLRQITVLAGAAAALMACATRQTEEETGDVEPAVADTGVMADTAIAPPADTGMAAPADTGFGAPADTGFGAPADTGMAPADTGFGDTGFGADTAVTTDTTAGQPVEAQPANPAEATDTAGVTDPAERPSDPAFQDSTLLRDTLGHGKEGEDPNVHPDTGTVTTDSLLMKLFR